MKDTLWQPWSGQNEEIATSKPTAVQHPSLLVATGTTNQGSPETQRHFVESICSKTGSFKVILCRPAK
jgi:hypothetical protein